MDGFAQGLNNGYIRQRIHEINMDKYKVIIVDDDDVALESLSFELGKDARFSLEKQPEMVNRERKRFSRHGRICFSGC